LAQVARVAADGLSIPDLRRLPEIQRIFGLSETARPRVDRPSGAHPLPVTPSMRMFFGMASIDL